MSCLPSRHRCAGRTAAFTLVELLVAATLALVVMAALVSLFGIFGRAVADSQDLVQLGARMRSAAWRLRQDLQGATSEAKPFIRPESACGYFELVEGPLVETGTTMLADVDDILMLTTASPGRPFTGLLSGTVSFESPVAEVAWFCKQGPQTADGLQLYNLYRRQLLVSAAPGAGVMQTTNSGTFSTWDAFYLSNDLSARREGSLLIANSLADLTRRPSRFLHNVSGAANPVVRDTWPQISATTSAVAGTSEVLTSVREGEDLLLANVIAFDVRVFDPAQANGGAYVNLGSGITTGNPGMVATQLTGTFTVTGTGAPPGMKMVPASTSWPTNAWKLYDTWSLHSESNNINDSVSNSPTDAGPTRIDLGTNFSDGSNVSSPVSNGVVDDAAEMELAYQRPNAIYNVPLRGVEIRIRCYEPSSQEVRQITVQHSFIAR